MKAAVEIRRVENEAHHRVQRLDRAGFAGFPFDLQPLFTERKNIADRMGTGPANHGLAPAEPGVVHENAASRPRREHTQIPLLDGTLIRKNPRDILLPW